MSGEKCGLGSREGYWVVSGSISDDLLGFRFAGSKRIRDGSKEGLAGTSDVNSINDQNTAITLLFKPSDTFTVKTRYNDRRSLRDIDRPIVIDEGYGGLRGMRSTNLFAYGVVAVPEGTPGAHRFTDPYTGAVAWGAPPRPGVDAAPAMPAHAFGGTAHLNGQGDLDAVEKKVLTNSYNNEEFDHESVSLDMTWEASEGVTVRYLFGYSDFEYTFDLDNDLDEVPIGSTLSGRWVGGDGSGDLYRHKNKSETDQYAVFAQGTYRLDERWAVTAGIRWAEDDKTVFENRGGYVEIDFLGAFSGLYPFLLPSPVLVVGQTDLSMTNILVGAAVPTGNPASPIAPTCPLNATECETPLRLAGIPLSWAGRAQASDTWGDVSWRLNLDWTPDDNTLVYVSATTGYRAGGYGLGIADARAGEAGSITPLSYDQEEVLAFELGYKGTLLDETLQLNMAVYTYDYENYQDQIDSYDPRQEVVRDVPTNTGDARNTGFEADITWLLLGHRRAPDVRLLRRIETLAMAFSER